MKQRFKRPVLLLLWLAIVFAAAAGRSSAAFFHTDPAWGSHGSAITDFNGEDDLVSALFLQPDGKLMVAGWVNIYPGDFGVARYLVDGRLDPAFGDGGRVTTAFSGGEERVDAAWSVNQRRDGGYLVFGETCDSDYMICELALAAYNADGSPDQDFGTQGLVTTNPGTISACAWPRRSIVQANGKLVAAGVALQKSGDIDLLLLRYNADGSLDKTFGKKGITIIDLEGTGSYPQDILPLPGNKILVVGGLGKTNAGNPYTYDAENGFLAVFNSSGALDSSFAGGEGYITWAYKGLNTGGQTALLADEKLYVMSYVDTNNGQCGLQRYDLDGRLDSAFGSGGWLLIGGPDYDYCWDLALTPDKKLVLAGETFPTYGVSRHSSSAVQGARRRPAAPDRRFSASVPDDIATILIGRYHLDGSPDESFGPEGLLRYAINEDGSSGIGLAVQPDGKMLVLSDVYLAESGQFDWGVVRFLEQGVATPLYLPVVAK